MWNNYKIIRSYIQPIFKRSPKEHNHAYQYTLRHKEPHNIATEISDLATNSKVTEYTITVFVKTSRHVKAKQVNSFLKKWLVKEIHSFLDMEASILETTVTLVALIPMDMVALMKFCWLNREKKKSDGEIIKSLNN